MLIVPWGHVERVHLVVYRQCSWCVSCWIWQVGDAKSGATRAKYLKLRSRVLAKMALWCAWCAARVISIAPGSTTLSRFNTRKHRIIDGDFWRFLYNIPSLVLRGVYWLCATSHAQTTYTLVPVNLLYAELHRSCSKMPKERTALGSDRGKSQQSFIMF